MFFRKVGFVYVNDEKYSFHYLNRKAEKTEVMTRNFTEAASRFEKAKEYTKSAGLIADSALTLLADATLPVRLHTK